MSTLIWIGYFLVGMVVINFLGMVVVPPIYKIWASKRIARRIMPSGICAENMAYIYKPPLRSPKFVNEIIARDKARRISDTTFFVTDVLVLALGGFLAGCCGLVFVGFPLNWKGIPGTAAFIAASFLAVSLIWG